ncbi:hypothetical protein H257_07443 [Aphanomyces astaci]|uniref:Uncharacterized protein n=1 Tax=Aphanomyces astaci TaxID=112090 RepID=W4GJC0_APHAT|nr:hypothetical protein H257_07443 [Aphanomyces astaci]ETV79431.1 hypothetical protein H257_07443 [Aphanomyces astaci]|eukprot:XP_009831272.1 hypothetical protein H257_07443 [Aphanomyces astaci]
MIVRAITTSTAAAERRTRLLKEAVRVQMISLAMSRGLTSVEAASHVDGTMMSTREQQRVSASLVDAPESEENQAPPSSNLIREIVGTDDVIDSTAVACRPRSSAESVELSSKPSHPPNPHQPEGLDGDASALQYTDQAAQELMHQELSALTATELRKIVQNHSAHHSDAVDSRLERDSAAAVEVNALADSMSLNNQLDDDMIHRVKHLSMCQQQQLSAIVHKQSLLHVTTQVLDMVHYMVFISVFVIVSMHGRHDDSPYKMTLSLMDQLQDKPWPSRVTSVTKTFRDNVDCIDELYDYLLGGFYDVVYSGGSFDGDNQFPSGNTYSSRGVLGGYGEIWGPIRIGQVRVVGVECTGMLIESSFLRNESTKCFPEYSAATASQDSYGLHGATYSYDAGPASIEPSFISHSARVYPAPSFNIYLPNHENALCNLDTLEHCDVYDQLAALKHSKFFDRATRAVFIDMTVYNRNVRDVSLVRLYVEAYPSGGMEPRGLFQTERLYAYSSSEDAVKLVGEALVLVAVTHQLYRMYMYPPLVQHASNHLHVFNLGLFYVIAVFKVLSYQSLPDIATISATEFLNFRQSAEYFWIAEAVASVVCLLAWIKLFYYLSFVPKFAQLMKTITKASKEMLGLMLIFMISLVGSAMAFNMTFGMRLYNYHTFWRSFLTLVQVIINKVEFEDLVETNQVLGPVFFCVFVTLMLFVILNMFIVIITDAYIDAQRELEVMQDIQLNVTSAEILDHLLHDVVLKLQWVGPHVFQPLYKMSVRVHKAYYAQRNDTTSDNKIGVHVHDGTVAAELEALVRMKHGALHQTKPIQHQHESFNGVAIPVESEESTHDDAQADDRQASTFAVIATEAADYVAAAKLVLATLDPAIDQAKVQAFHDHLDTWLDFAQYK